MSAEQFEEICLRNGDSDDESIEKVSRRWIFCNHCQQKVSKSTYYRHQRECSAPANRDEVYGDFDDTNMETGYYEELDDQDFVWPDSATVMDHETEHELQANQEASNNSVIWLYNKNIAVFYFLIII